MGFPSRRRPRLLRLPLQPADAPQARTRKPRAGGGPLSVEGGGLRAMAPGG
jgi:hypothetical protein